MSEDFRERPDYADGYEAAWHGRGAKTGTPEYIAGYEAAMKARRMFEEAGFIRGRGGIYTKPLTMTARPETAPSRETDDAV